MATSQMSEVIQHLRRAVLLRDGAGLTDGQLLTDYVSRRDEAALEALVRRHGAMVWGVCRRVLPDFHDAEDAFQATFLVFVRKAASIASRELLANWLYGVAHQTALKARATAARRKGRERQVTQMPEPAVAEQDLWRDLQPLLDEELSRLPDRYRAVIVLCDLEGKTRSEAAGQLGVPEGTVAGWLARARARLAERLTQRGIAVSGGGAFALLLSQQVASAGVPTSVVVSSTINAATLYAAGQAAASGAIPAQVTALTEGMLKAMFLTKLKAVSVVLLVVATLSGAAGVIYRTQAAEQPRARAASERADKEKQPDPEPKDEEKSEFLPSVDPTKTDLARLQGVWKLEYVEVDGRAQKMEYYKTFRCVIKGNKLTLGSNDGHDETGSVRVDSTKKPKEIDMITTHPAGHLLTYPGIYKLHGDKLTICYAPHLDAGQLRPTEFETAKEGGRLWVLVRTPREKAARKGGK
jgi:RNA polymerase sigma factor (sigma-70 family)